MTFDRRRFIEIAGLGTAAWITGACSRSPESASAARSQDQQTAGSVTLKMTLWGSFLYAFPRGGAAVEVSALTTQRGVPEDCKAPSHRPQVEIDTTTCRVRENGSTFGPGDVPSGVYRLDLPSGQPPLKSPPVQVPLPKCPDDFNDLGSSVHMPVLQVPGATTAGWRDRFGTRFAFDTGDFKPARPKYFQNWIAMWTVRTGGENSGPYPFTDTFMLEVPLTDRQVVLVSDKGDRLTLEALGSSKTIELTLMAHPAEDRTPLQKGDEDPHHCAVYAVFDQPPAKPARGTLIFDSWCEASASERLPEPAGLAAEPRFFSPWKYCTGGAVIV